MSRRILLVGQGHIGREVFAEYRDTLADHRLMVTDPAVPSPDDYGWDQEPVDVAVVMVDTPGDRHLSGFDYRQLTAAVAQCLEMAQFVVVKSTVGLDFVQSAPYRDHFDRIGFSPEFYGTTRHSRREVIDLGYAMFSFAVPQWYADAVCNHGAKQLWGTAREVIMAKLAENAFLATKVTFFHELALTCEHLGVSFEAVRELVTADPRITAHHSYCFDGPGWTSHCWDKDVPVYAGLGPDTQLVRAVRAINADHLLKVRPRPNP